MLESCFVESNPVELHGCSAEGTTASALDSDEALFADAVIVATDEQGFALLVVVNVVADVAVSVHRDH
jgi:hypothetical protein